MNSELNGEETSLHSKRQLLIKKIRDYAESLKEKSTEDESSSPVNGIVDECISALDKLDDVKTTNIKKKNSSGRLKEKEFVARNSLLTDLFEINHFQTILNIFIVILILLFVNNIFDELFSTGSSTRGSTQISGIIWNFSRMDKVFQIWIVMFMSTIFLVYPGFQVWSHKTTVNDKTWNKLWLSLYVIYFCAVFYYPPKYIINFGLPPVCSMIVVAEQLRMLMKTYSFVRHNAERVLYPKTDKEKANPCPEFSKYLYFLFVPTLIYRDEYPRTNNIRIKFVITNFCQVIGCIFYMSIVITDHFLVFHDIGLSTTSLQKVLRSVISAMIPATILLLCSFFLILHSWMNAFAELLRFADRQFYTDWWNSQNYATYYRTWNIVVHDWLYTYIFRDLALLNPANKILPIFSVFFISSIVHDYVMTFTLRFFLPTHIVMFGGVGAGFFFVPSKGNRRSWSMFFWASMITGVGIMGCLYSMEFYARKNCSPYFDSSLDYFFPRMITCF